MADAKGMKNISFYECVCGGRGEAGTMTIKMKRVLTMSVSQKPEPALCRFRIAAIRINSTMQISPCLPKEAGKALDMLFQTMNNVLVSVEKN